MTFLPGISDVRIELRGMRGNALHGLKSRSSRGNEREGKNLARNASKLKLSYYPLAEREGMRIRRFLQFAGAASVLDPCAGTGAALRTITPELCAVAAGRVRAEA